MAQVRGSAAATAVMIMVTMSMLFQCQVAEAADPTPVTWANGSGYGNGRTVKKGQTLAFTYNTNQHNLVEVDENGYTNCKQSGNKPPLPNPKAVKFDATGTRYFICTFPNHCSAGKMKIKVTATL